MSTHTLLLWNLRTWPKAQYLARALGIPAEAWEIPFLFAPLGGPELSIFEAMEKPELGGLTGRLKALTKPLAAAASTDPWVSHNIAQSKLAVAFHPGVSMAQAREMTTQDGYRVVGISEALAERRTAEIDPSLSDEGLIDQHARLRRTWAGADDETIIANTLLLPVWEHRHHSAAFFLCAQAKAWRNLAPSPRDALEALITEDIAHPVLTKRWLTRNTAR